MYIGTKGKIKPMKMVFYFQGSRCFGSYWGFYDKGNNKLIKFKNASFKADTSEADLSYFAPDCFHLSEKGHKAAAEALWNNMVIIRNTDCELMWLYGQITKLN